MVKILNNMKYNPALFIGVMFICFLVSTGVRYQQFNIWEKTPSFFFVGERPMMTTLDAPYWLRLAKEYNEGIFGQKSSLRNFPDSKDLSIPNKYKDQNTVSSISKTPHTDTIPL